MSMNFLSNVVSRFGVVFCGVLVAVPSALAGQDQMPFNTVEASVDFGNFEIPTIPADFFGPGSDPFGGAILLGTPLGRPDTIPDTIVERLGPVVCGPFPSTCDPIPIEIVQLSLVGTNPITVTFNGGQDPENWLVAMGLSDTQGPGLLNAELEQANGGTFTVQLPVTPRLLFTRAGEFDRILDFAVEGIPPIDLSDGARPWDGFLTGDFVPYGGGQGQLQSGKGSVSHTIELASVPIPTVSTWGMAVMVLLVLSTASILLMRRRAIDVSL